MLNSTSRPRGFSKQKKDRERENCVISKTTHLWRYVDNDDRPRPVAEFAFQIRQISHPTPSSCCSASNKKAPSAVRPPQPSSNKGRLYLKLKTIQYWLQELTLKLQVRVWLTSTTFFRQEDWWEENPKYGTSWRRGMGWGEGRSKAINGSTWAWRMEWK